MEEIQIRDALRHHVTTNEPPMGLSAADLLHKGRRRHWWRMGMASGGTVAAISMVAMIALVPMGGTDQTLDSTCGLPVVDNYVAQPSTEPDHPSPYPTSTATVDPSPHPTEIPTPYPTNEPTPDPTSYPTPDTTAYPTPEPTAVVVFPDPPWTTAVPTYPADEPRMREMECYLKAELQRLAPGAKFAVASDHGPLTVYSGTDYRWQGRDGDRVYVATAIIIGRRQTVQFVVSVEKPWGQPTGPEFGWSYEKRGDLVIRQLRRQDGILMSEVYTPNSTIFVHVTGTLLSPEQLIELSSATEMDIFR